MLPLAFFISLIKITFQLRPNTFTLCQRKFDILQLGIQLFNNYPLYFLLYLFYTAAIVLVYIVCLHLVNLHLSTEPVYVGEPDCRL